MEDDDSQWEQIHSPFSHTNIAPWNFQSLRIDNHFPQNNLQTEPPIDLPPQQQPDSPPSPPSSSSSSPTPPPDSPPAAPPSTSSSTNLKAGGDEEPRRPPRRRGSLAAAEIAARLRLRLRILSAEARRVAAGALAAGRLWSSAASALAGVLAAFLISILCRRWRRRALAARDRGNQRLVLLLREKDEKIGQLMIRIVEMNEALSARSRVPVIRVGQFVMP